MYYGKIIELLCVLYIRRISNGLIYIFLASVLAPEFELEGYMVKIQLLIRIGNFGTRSRIKKNAGHIYSCIFLMICKIVFYKLLIVFPTFEHQNHHSFDEKQWYSKSQHLF